MKRSPYFIPAILVLILLMGALVVIRTDRGGEESDEPLYMRVSEGIVYAVIAIGLAFLAELIIRSLIPASRDARERARLKKAFVTTDKKKRYADEKITKIYDESNRHKYWESRIEGKYNRIWLPANAEAGYPAAPASPTSTSDT
jgi:hypothetical protein